MKIGMDVSFISGEKSGIERYAASLVNGLAKIDCKNDYFLYTYRRTRSDLAANKTNFTFRVSEKYFFYTALWVKFYLPVTAKRDKVDILHCPCYIAPVTDSFRVVITIHDMASWIFPENFPLKHRMVYSLLVPSSARKAARIIAVSESTKRDIVKFFRIPEEKIEVIYEGVSEIYKPVKDENLLKGTRRKYDIPPSSPYILCVGTLEPRKNVARLIESFVYLKADGKIKQKLVIAGGKGWLYDDIFRTVEKFKVREEVIFTGCVPEGDLPSLYSGADLFVYPSLYEGFGLPPLEAMACGAPVVSSDVSSLPEVVGDAGILVNPYEKEELAKSIYEVINNPELKKKMISKGIERAKKFSWQTAARKTLALYEDVVRKP